MEFVRTNVTDGIAVVTLDRPPVNAVNQPMYREITTTFGSFADRDDVRVVVVTAAGTKAFVAGNDLHEFVTMTPENGGERMRVAREAFWAIYECAVPVIGAVGGAALGTGLGIAACCDMLVASEKATFGLPEINVGVLGGARFTARLVPELVMRKIFFTGEPVSAAELARHGAVISVVPHDELMNTALALARKVAAKSPMAVRMAKHALNGCEFMDLKRGYEFEQGFTVKLSGFADAKEAVQAILEKRPPRFTGR
jgi:enoyl-CoA hydratase/carnithine racemase